MKKTSRTRAKWVSVSIVCTLTVLAAIVVFSPRTPLAGTLSGRAQLVSIQPYPETDGAMCVMEQASAQGSLMAALQQRQT